MLERSYCGSSFLMQLFAWICYFLPIEALLTVFLSFLNYPNSLYLPLLFTFYILHSPYTNFRSISSYAGWSFCMLFRKTFA